MVSPVASNARCKHVDTSLVVNCPFEHSKEFGVASEVRIVAVEVQRARNNLEGLATACIPRSPELQWPENLHWVQLIEVNGLR